jgi:NlpC/P60 family putative phage cell wall peptidase
MTSRILTRPAILSEARGWIGTPYRHQASVKGVGCDCLGLLRGVWRGLIGEEPEAIPPYAASWADAARGETFAEAGLRHLVPIDPAAFRAGDVILFRWRAHLPARHCAIASDDAREPAPGMIHAHDGAAVAEVILNNWWRRHVAYAFSFPGVTD